MKEQEEIWKDVEGYEGLYQVSQRGNVRSKNGFTNWTVLSPGRSWGYLFVALSKQGKKKKSFRVNRLVAMAFIPNPLNKPQVNHKNSKRDDNRVDNLEWCTNSENQIHGYKMGRISAKAKAVAQYDLHGNLVAKFRTAMETVRFGFNRKSISNVIRGRAKTHKGFKWELV